jgi:hypothetical protein
MSLVPPYRKTVVGFDVFRLVCLHVTLDERQTHCRNRLARHGPFSTELAIEPGRTTHQTPPCLGRAYTAEKSIAIAVPSRPCRLVSALPEPATQPARQPRAACSSVLIVYTKYEKRQQELQEVNFSGRLHRPYAPLRSGTRSGSVPPALSTPVRGRQCKMPASGCVRPAPCHTRPDGSTGETLRQMPHGVGQLAQESLRRPHCAPFVPRVAPP